MSENQYIGFRAIDGPVSDKNLAFMRKQSSRAEITPWTFDNEYHFGDFHGDAVEMLRRGYDFHLHYANFGERTVMIRLPHGLPDPAAAEPYFEKDSLYLLKDRKGEGGILRISPYFEAGELEELWEVENLIDRLLPLRAEILDGDLRVLYLAQLAVACDDNHDPDEAKEGPVPAGLGRLSAAQQALAEFYGLSKSLLAAAAKDSPALSERGDATRHYAAWLQGQPEATRNGWLAQLLADPRSTVRRDILAAFQRSQHTPSWPTLRLDRTIADLRATAEGLHHKATRQAAARAARAREKKLAAMAADPTTTLRETEKLVQLRGRDAYEQTATLLADLREALAGTARAGLAEDRARKLRNSHPTLRVLVSALRHQGFLQK